MTAPFVDPAVSGELKPDWRLLGQMYQDARSADQIREHYALERRLSDQLRFASAEERLSLYGPAYDELFARLPHHPQFTRRRDDTEYAAKQLRLLMRLIPRDSVFLEIGAGDCRVSIELASRWCKQTIAVDVSDKVLAPGPHPGNFRFVLTSGLSIAVDSNSVHFAYSNQLMEHLHPDDAIQQLSEIHRVLRPGGLYLCITPSCLTGPHDISRYFDKVASGFHLIEYDYTRMAPILRKAGFSNLRACITRGGHYAGALPINAAIAYERLFSTLPSRLRAWSGRKRIVRAALGVAVLAQKPG